MSDKAMSRLYQAPHSNSISTTPGGGMDIFGFQERRRSREMEHQAQLEKDMADIEQKHQVELENLKAQHAKDLTSSTQVTDFLKANNLPDTPENRDRVAGDLSEQNYQNALVKSKMQASALQASGTQDAINLGTRLQASGFPPQMLGGTAPMGGITTIPQVPGVNAPLGSPLGVQQLKGGTAQDTTKVVGQFPMTINGQTQMVGGHPIEEKRTTSGTFNSPQAPASQDEIKQFFQNQQPQSSITPPVSMPDDRQFAPIPANQQSNNGITTTPQDMSNLTLGGGASKSPLQMILEYLQSQKYNPTSASDLPAYPGMH